MAMKKLRTLRINAGLSIKTAAFLLGIKPCTLYKIENEQRRPSNELKHKMCALYKCDFEDL